MPDWSLNIKVNGQQEAASAVKQLTNELNEQEKAAKSQTRPGSDIGKVSPAARQHGEG